MPNSSSIELALGPCLFNWPADRLLAFYKKIATEAPIDRVYLGEVVCGKRMPFTDNIWPEAIEALEAAGKEVVLSTLAQPVNKRERQILQQQAGYDMPIEVNDMSMVPARKQGTFAVGPYLNVYNEATLSFLARQGARTWCPPVELSLDSIQKIAALVPEVDLELFAFGRLPLALSSRCYHARAHGLRKDSCQFICEQDPDGMDVATLDGRRFLAANGIQTLSDACHFAGLSAGHLATLGIKRLRLSPHTTDMIAVSRLFRDFLDGHCDVDKFEQQLEMLNLPGPLCNAYLLGDAGWKRMALPA
ncbi:MAG: U32 family peptidase [Roseibium sp.]|uniref:ubiquinone anaerobic biosynthesis protein UbiV n=1 Tax=Roseibium sp. TaxID=1936156 RepID=UPI001B16D8F5|nr:U32 family peptidase [Roseibium sp.]MBO6895250.1 U32 family peptidase [Roseibium sp.]MBO6929814.1 U32 family peptidase [Roseibium sp.]